MFRSVPFALGVILVLACDTTPRRSGTASTPRADTVGQGLAGSEFQATPLIAPMRDQLRRFAAQPSTATQANLTAYKNQLTHLTAAMQTDLRRAGGGPPSALAQIQTLSDSVNDDLGGGTGLATGLQDGGIDSVRLDQHIGRVEYLIGLYEEAMRRSAD